LPHNYTLFSYVFFVHHPVIKLATKIEGELAETIVRDEWISSWTCIFIFFFSSYNF